MPRKSIFIFHRDKLRVKKNWNVRKHDVQCFAKDTIGQKSLINRVRKLIGFNIIIKFFFIFWLFATFVYILSSTHINTHVSLYVCKIWQNTEAEIEFLRNVSIGSADKTATRLIGSGLRVKCEANGIREFRLPNFVIWTAIRKPSRGHPCPHTRSHVQVPRPLFDKWYDFARVRSEVSRSSTERHEHVRNGFREVSCKDSSDLAMNYVPVDGRPSALNRLLDYSHCRHFWC